MNSATAPPGAPAVPRASPLLDAPILSSILRLTAPNLVLALFQSAVSIADTHYIGRFGTDALAGLALAFPLVMLLQMLSAGAMGGGVSSAIARALGAGELARARSLVAHALAIALAAGALFTLLLLTCGAALYALLGGTGQALAEALIVGGALVLQLGASLGWLFAVVALGLVSLGTCTALAVHRTAWGK